MTFVNIFSSKRNIESDSKNISDANNSSGDLVNNIYHHRKMPLTIQQFKDPTPSTFIFRRITCPLDVIKEDETVASEESRTTIGCESSSSFTNRSNTIPRHLRRGPSYELAQTGEIMAKFMSSGKLFNKWKECVWAHFLPSLVLFFSCDDAFHSYMTNPILSVESRMRLIEFALDFDTCGVVQRMKNSQKGKKQTLFMQFELNKIKSKPHRPKGTILYSFKIERLTQSGSTIPVKLASTDTRKINDMRKVAKTCIKNAKKDSVGKTQ